jgi:uncharacterized protein
VKTLTRTFVLAVAVLLALVTVPSAAQAQTPQPGQRTITVTGVGSAYTSPDIAYLSLGVNIANENLATGIKNADTQIAAIKASLKASGIAENDIQTAQYNVYQEGPPPGAPGRQQYHVVNILRATVRDMSKVGDILNKAVAAGANTIYGVDLSVKDTHASETTARKAAFDDAKARATELASNMGGTLGQVVSITESTGGVLPPGARGLGGGGGGGGGGISGGSLEVTVSLTVTFEVK